MKPEMPIQRKRLMAVTLAVVALGAIFLLVMAIPFFMRSNTVSHSQQCIGNLRHIEAAKEQAAWQHGWPDGTDCDLPENKALVHGYMRGGGPFCPAGGIYSYNKYGEVATCSLADPSDPWRLHFLSGYTQHDGTVVPLPVSDIANVLPAPEAVPAAVPDPASEDDLPAVLIDGDDDSEAVRRSHPSEERQAIVRQLERLLEQASAAEGAERERLLEQARQLLANLIW